MYLKCNRPNGNATVCNTTFKGLSLNVVFQRNILQFKAQYIFLTRKCPSGTFSS